MMQMRDYPNIDFIVASVLRDWPAHKRFLDLSFANYEPVDLNILEELAAKIRSLAQDDIDDYVRSYRWTCGELNKEALYFKRSSRYRISSFDEAKRSIYSNADYMKSYMQGLLLSQLLWQNHAAAYLYYCNEYLPRFRTPFRYLEIGPGHGLFMSAAASLPDCIAAEGWDISPESIRQSRHALRVLGCGANVSVLERDVMASPPDNAPSFDAIAISEVLEHIEQPLAALKSLRQRLSPGGAFFINVPINSPAPDHIYLLRDVAEARGLVEEAGLNVLDLKLIPMTGLSLFEAEKQKATISCVFVAQ
ncbi:MAG: class I SAM-dependent methyltransferase [Phenylobacterium sp.]|jgi:2-polyprenyl-3-methyl-5-hydroxy-6-metoxy-1,4-benzoquinol methylase|nr:class I SAM-dependent methyltransferase [Phenylobacterium sp.]